MSQINIDSGPKDPIWKGLGVQIDITQSAKDWQEAAGMTFSVEESKVLYDAAGSIHELPGKKVLYRSDNYKPLSIVGNEFKIIQPENVITFFKGIADNHGMTINAFGTLFDGVRFWAIADTKREAEVTPGDTIRCQLLMTTSVDGYFSTVGKLINSRDYSNGTCMVAFGEAGNVLKVTHKKDLDPNAVKINMNVVDAKWNQQVNNIKKLASIEMNEDQTRSFFQDRFFDPKKIDEDQTWGARKFVDSLTALSVNGSGSAMSAVLGGEQCVVPPSSILMETVSENQIISFGILILALKPTSHSTSTEIW
jgi:phage/plasmid-like protein (TIGR03299 family)